MLWLCRAQRRAASRGSDAPAVVQAPPPAAAPPSTQAHPLPAAAPAGPPCSCPRRRAGPAGHGCMMQAGKDCRSVVPDTSCQRAHLCSGGKARKVAGSDCRHSLQVRYFVWFILVLQRPDAERALAEQLEKEGRRGRASAVAAGGRAEQRRAWRWRCDSNGILT